MGKNSRQKRWDNRGIDLANRFKNRLEIAGYTATSVYIGEFIKPDRITSSWVFEIISDAPYDAVKNAIGDLSLLNTELSHVKNDVYQVWYG